MAKANVANTSVVPVETTLTPFYDDFDETKNFHRLLFRPGYAVQARELTQLQTILQNQIERFGQHIFVNGSSVIGGQLDYTEIVTINTNPEYANSAVDISLFKDKTVKLSSGNNDVIARVIQVSPATATEPAALHLKYVSGLEFNAGDVIKIDGENTFVELVSTANVAANGSLAFLYDSIYFYNGFFVKVPTQSIVLSKYDRNTSARVGLELDDSVITEDSDTSLLDPALEASNYQAPGAARYKMELVLAKRSLTSTDDEQFIEIARIENGQIKSQVVNPIYSEIEEVLARRTYDESGNYVTKSFVLNVEDSQINPANNFTLSISPGKAYIYGYEYETRSDTKIEIPRARDVNVKTDYRLNLNYGNYFRANNLSGAFNTNGFGEVDLHCVKKSLISYANSSTYNSTKIGSARIKDLEFVSGGAIETNREFEFYFADPSFKAVTATASSAASSKNQIIMNVPEISSVDDAYTGAYISINSGASAGDERFITAYDGATKTATVEPEFSFFTDSTTSFTIKFDMTDVDSVVQSSSFGNATSNASIDVSLESKDNGAFTGNTVINDPVLVGNVFKLPESFIRPGITGQSYQYRRVYSDVQFTNGVSSVLNASTDENFVGGTSGSSISDTVLNNYLVIVKNPQTSGRSEGDQVSITTSVTTSTPEQLTLSTGVTENFTATVYAKMEVFDSAATQRVKTLVLANTQTLASEAAANTFLNSTGSTTYVFPDSGQVVILNPSKSTTELESLYLSDVLAVKKIYAFSGNTIPAAGSTISNLLDVTNRYEVDSGRRYEYYDHAQIRLKPGYAAIQGGGIIVCCRYYKSSNDTGYFSVDSYPRLNENIVEEGVSIGTGYSLIPYFQNMKSSDFIDFRPVRPNASASTNFTPNSVKTPIPATDFELSYAYYLSRRDLVILSSNRSISLVQGISAINPNFPLVPSKSIILQRLSLTPYTETKRDVFIENINHRRYTMADIANIDRRVKNLEYTVSLNQIEKDAFDTQILDVDGLDRTKYGVLVDTFSSHLLSEKDRPDYLCAIDYRGFTGTDRKGLLMPSLSVKDIELEANVSTRANTSVHEHTITLSYTTVPAITQNSATKTTPVTEYLFGRFYGTIITSPEADIWKDSSVNPGEDISVPTAINIQVETVTPPPPPDVQPSGDNRTFSLLVDRDTVNEGENVTFTLATTNVAVGSTFTYRIVGVSASDVVGGRLSGLTAIGANGNSYITIGIAQDALTEGEETLTVLVAERANAVVITDTSITPTQTFDLTSNTSVVNEGQAVVFTLSTSNVNVGTSYAYTITGVSSSDIVGGALSGTANIAANGNAVVTVVTTEDQLTEGVEYLTLTIASRSRTVVVQDSSINVQTFRISSNTDVLNEGGAAVFTIETTNVANGAQLEYVITGVDAADITSNLTGNVVVGANGNAYATIVTVADLKTEGVEYLSFILSGTGQFLTLPILDTSLNVETFSLTANTASVNEGEAILFELSTSNVNTNSVFSYSITGTTANDIVGGASALTGNLTIGANGNAYATVVTIADNRTDGEQILVFSVNTRLATGNVATSVSIKDTSQNLQTFSLTSSANTVNEGESIIFTLQTTNVATNTVFSYFLGGVDANDVVGDASALTGNLTIGANGNAYTTITTVQDQRTEGTERLVLYTVSNTVSRSVDILDTSLNVQTFSLTSNAEVINEGQAVLFTLATTNVAANTVYSYNLTGITSTDIVGPISGSTVVRANGNANILVVSTEDFMTEDVETMVLTVAGRAKSVAIQDTSKSNQSFELVSNTNLINEGQAVLFTLVTTNVATGTIYNYTITGTNVTTTDIVGGNLTGNTTVTSFGNAFITVVAANDFHTEGSEALTLTVANVSKTIAITDTSKSNQSFELVSNTNIINEGQAVVFTLVTTNVAPGTIYNYTITGTNVTTSDIVGGNLTGTTSIQANGNGYITIVAADDFNSEGSEALTLTVANLSRTIGINDTSVGNVVYRLTVNTSQIFEGSGALFSVNTTNVAANTNVFYRVSGVDANDITLGSLTGTVFIGANGNGFINIVAVNDAVVEGSETLILTVANSVSNSVVILDRIPTYRLTVNTSQIFEGNGALFTVNTTNIASGTNLFYRISGVDANDITLGSLTGNVTIGANGNGFINITATEDAVSEGSETLILTVANSVSNSVVILDRIPTFSRLSANASEIFEGSTVVFTIETANIASGTNLTYQISGAGITANDINASSLSGSMTVRANGNAYAVIETVNDFTLFDENDEYLTLSVGGLANTVIIRDRRATVHVLPPTDIFYGESAVFTILTTNVQANTNLTFYVVTNENYYNVRSFVNGFNGDSFPNNFGPSGRSDPANGSIISGNSVNNISDINTILPGNVPSPQIVTIGANGRGYITISTVSSSLNDYYTNFQNSLSLPQGKARKLGVGIRTDQPGTFITKPTYINVIAKRPTAELNVLDKNDSRPSYYFVTEGENVTFSLVTSNVNPGTNVYYIIRGTNIDQDDIDVPLQGYITIGANGRGYLPVNTKINLDRSDDVIGYDTATFEVMTVNIPQTESSSLLLTSNGAIITSRFITSSMTCNVTSINEGQSAMFIVQTSNVAEGQLITFRVSGIQREDLTDATYSTLSNVVFTDPSLGQGTFTARAPIRANGNAYVILTTSEDTSNNEGAETMTLTLISPYDQRSTIVYQSNSVLIRDTSVLTLIPTFALESSAATVNEGDNVTFTLVTSNVATGSVYNYRITGIQTTDIVSGSLTGSVIVTSNGRGYIPLRTVADSLTEGPETLTLTVETIPSVSNSVVISDTSTAPVPTFNLVANTTTINEGQTVRFTLLTTNVDAGTNYTYTLTGISSDDIVGGNLTGVFTIDSSGNALVDVTTVEDLSTGEGGEVMTLSLGAPINRAVAVTIVDSSRVVVEQRDFKVLMYQDTSAANYYGVGRGLGNVSTTDLGGVATGNLNKDYLIINGIFQTIGINWDQAKNIMETQLLRNLGKTTTISIDNIQYVNSLYVNIVNRPPEFGGLTYWTDRLQDLYKGDRSSLTAEFFRVVAGWGILDIPTGQLFEQGGFEVPTSSSVYAALSTNHGTFSEAQLVIASGATIVRTAYNYDSIMASGIGSSRNVTQGEIIEDFYKYFLGRTPGRQEVDYWVNYNRQFGIVKTIDDMLIASGTQVRAR